MKPFFIFNYELRKKEIDKSKKLLKMNNTNFDPTQYGRMTVFNPIQSNNVDEESIKRNTTKRSASGER